MKKKNADLFVFFSAMFFIYLENVVGYLALQINTLSSEGRRFLGLTPCWARASLDGVFIFSLCLRWLTLINSSCSPKTSKLR